MLEVDICRWCDTELSLYNDAGHCVCIKCYTLLSDAGVSVDEIFTVPDFSPQANYLPNSTARDDADHDET